VLVLVLVLVPVPLAGALRGAQRRGRGTSRSSTVLRSSRAAARIASSQIARTCSDSTSTTASLVLKPARSLMYFLSFDTTISTSRSASASLTVPSTAAAVVGETSPTTRRTGAAAGAAAGLGAGGGFVASSLSHASLLGARASTAHASRWRASATWLSQHDTVQNT